MFSYVTCMHIVNFTTMQLHFGSVQYMQQSNLESIHILYSAIRFLVLVLSTSNSYIKHCHLSKSTITEQGYCKAMIISWPQNEPAACIISESCGQQSQSVHKIDENFAKNCFLYVIILQKFCPQLNQKLALSLRVYPQFEHIVNMHTK